MDKSVFRVSEVKLWERRHDVRAGTVCLVLNKKHKVHQEQEQVWQ